jgi:hypothetical protein
MLRIILAGEESPADRNFCEGSRKVTRRLEIMYRSIFSSAARIRILCGLGLASLITTTGCQVDVGGQTLPSPWYMKDDVQYYAPGPEFKLAREAAAMREFQDNQNLQQQ